jgi:hypothetical protein
MVERAGTIADGSFSTLALVMARTNGCSFNSMPPSRHLRGKQTGLQDRGDLRELRQRERTR